MYNSKFQEFETVRTLKIHKNDQIWTKKEKKRKGICKVAFIFLSSSFVGFS